MDYIKSDAKFISIVEILSLSEVFFNIEFASMVKRNKIIWN